MTRDQAADVAITVRYIEPDDMASHIEAVFGWREVEVAGKFYAIPTDPEHPDFAYCERRLARARKRAA